MANDVLLRSALLGASAGARSLTPLAVLVTRKPGWTQRPGWVRGLAGAAALGELGLDKLPRAPSRLSPGPLAGRIVLGALVGGGYARRRGAGVVLPALTAAVAAVAASYAGAQWRAFAARRSLNLPGAVAEDAAAVTLAWAASRATATAQ